MNVSKKTHGREGGDARQPAGPHQGQALPDQHSGLLWLHDSIHRQRKSHWNYLSVLWCGLP